MVTNTTNYVSTRVMVDFETYAKHEGVVLNEVLLKSPSLVNDIGTTLLSVVLESTGIGWFLAVGSIMFLIIRYCGVGYLIARFIPVVLV